MPPLRGFASKSSLRLTAGVTMRTRGNGFTFVELLIVIVIIGILASVAIPKFRNTKDRAYVATLKSDLRHLATSQESYLYDYATYYDGAIPTPELGFDPSEGVTITLNAVTMSGWSATAKHISDPAGTCALFHGNVPPQAPATVEGETMCN
jgi:prepilin-type N-terminal cleavage/methylation domain-containing protein